MAKVKSFGERIADALVEDGLLSAGQIEELLEQQKKGGARLIKLIVDKSYVSEQDLAVSMGRVLNVPPINLGRVSIPPEVVELLPQKRRMRCLTTIVNQRGKTVIDGESIVQKDPH